MRFRLRAALLTLWCVALPAGAAPGFPVRVTDDAGTAVALAAPPSRIVSLTLPTEEMLTDLVDLSRLQAMTYLSMDAAVSNVAGRVAPVPHKLDLNVEEILSLSPDLVLVADWNDAGAVAQLRAAGVPVYLIKSAVTVASIEQKIARLALLTGEQDRGRAMIQRMESRLAAVARAVADIPADRRLSVIDYATWGSAQGRGSSWDEMLRCAGLVDAAGSLAADEWGQVPLSREKLLEMDPQVLVLPGWVYNNPGGAAAFYQRITRDPSLRGLQAVKAGRVYMMPERLKSATSQYFADAVEWLARTAYPGILK